MPTVAKPLSKHPACVNLQKNRFRRSSSILPPNEANRFMIEWISNPPWWFTAAIGALMPSAFGRLRRAFQLSLQHTQGRVKAGYRRLQLRRLVKIKASRFDSVRINREIVLSYALFSLFILTGVSYITGLFMIPVDIRSNYRLATVWGLVTALPALVFEFAWLNSSSRVDALLKYRRKIKRRQKRLS